MLPYQANGIRAELGPRRARASPGCSRHHGGTSAIMQGGHNHRAQPPLWLSLGRRSNAQAAAGVRPQRAQTARPAASPGVRATPSDRPRHRTSGRPGGRAPSATSPAALLGPNGRPARPSDRGPRQDSLLPRRPPRRQRASAVGTLPPGRSPGGRLPARIERRVGATRRCQKQPDRRTAVGRTGRPTRAPRRSAMAPPRARAQHAAPPGSASPRPGPTGARTAQCAASAGAPTGRTHIVHHRGRPWRRCATPRRLPHSVRLGGAQRRHLPAQPGVRHQPPAGPSAAPRQRRCANRAAPVPTWPALPRRRRRVRYLARRPAPGSHRPNPALPGPHLRLQHQRPPAQRPAKAQCRAPAPGCGRPERREVWRRHFHQKATVRRQLRAELLRQHLGVTCPALQLLGMLPRHVALVHQRWHRLIGHRDFETFRRLLQPAQQRGPAGVQRPWLPHRRCRLPGCLRPSPTVASGSTPTRNLLRTHAGTTVRRQCSSEGDGHQGHA